MPAEEFGSDYEFFRADERLSFDEIERVAGAFARLGVHKIRITGGEPLLRKNLHRLVARLKRLPGIDDLALTTNGVLLGRQAWALKSAGLDRVSVSLDTVDEEVFGTMSGGRGTLSPVLDGLKTAQKAGLGPIKINVVVQRGVNDHTVMDLMSRFRHSDCVVRFIEYMDVGNKNHWKMDHVVPSAELVEQINDRWAIKPLDPNYHGEVAKRYEFEDGSGEVGFISSVTAPFCGGCTRARVSTSGVFYTCLFATHGTDLRGPLRAGIDDEALIRLIGSRWGLRADRYSEARDPHAPKHGMEKVEMFQVGG